MVLFHKKVALEISQRDFTRAMLMTFDSFNSIRADVHGERRNPTFFFMFGRRALIPVDIILGVPCTSGSGTRLGYSRRTVGNLPLAYEKACRNVQERTDKQT